MAGTVTFIGVGGTEAKVIDGSTITGWLSGSPALNTDIFLLTGSVSEKVSAATVYTYALGAGLVGEPWNFSSGGGDDGNHIFMIAQIQGAADTLANGGFGIVVADDVATDSVGVWYVGPQVGSLGGWEYFVIDPSKQFDAVTVAGTSTWTTSGNPAQLSGVDGIGVRWKVTNTIMGASDNSFIQTVSVGVGYRVTGASSLFDDFSSYETTNRYGALQTKSGILFPLGKLRIGIASGAGNTTFTDSGFTVIWQGQTRPDGTTKATATGFYALVADKGSGTTDITLSDGTLAAASPEYFDLDLSAATTATITNVAVNRARLVTLSTTTTWLGGQITNSGVVTAAGASFKEVKVLTSIVAADASALVWNVATDPDGKLDDCTFSKGTNAHHAIQLGASAPATVTLRGMTFTGFNASNEQNDSVILLADTGSNRAWTINAVGCSGTVSVKKTRSGDTYTVVADPVTTSIHVQDVNTAAAITGARVLVYCATGGGKPGDVTVTATASGTTATVTHTAHGLSTGDKVLIKGSTIAAYNGVWTITNTGANTYTYTMGSSPASPATGTLKASLVVIDATVDGSGNASDTRTWPSDQPVTGRVRKGSAATYYKSAPITGTIDSTAGFSATIQMIPDA
jgi:hypothetical protein